MRTIVGRAGGGLALGWRWAGAGLAVGWWWADGGQGGCRQALAGLGTQGYSSEGQHSQVYFGVLGTDGREV